MPFSLYSLAIWCLVSSTWHLPAIMENVLQGISNVVAYLDDILLSSANKSDHLKLMDQVLDRLEKLD